MQIKIVSVGQPEMKQGPKAKYSVFELEYSSDGSLRKRKIMSFSKEVYGQLKASQPGESYDIVTKKNGDFWEWVSCTRLNDASGTQSNSGSSSSATAASSGGYSRESAEERAQRQVMIVRQNSMGHAVEILGAGKNLQEYLEVANNIVDWVMTFDDPDNADPEVE